MAERCSASDLGDSEMEAGIKPPVIGEAGRLLAR